MKNLTLLLFLVIFVSPSFSQKSVNKFYRQLKKESNARTIAVPGIAFKVGAAVSKKQVKDDPVAAMGLKMAKKIKGLKVLMVEDYSPDNNSAVTDFVNNAHQKSGLEDLFMFKAAGSDIHFMTKDKGDIIKNLVILVYSEEDGLMLMNMKSKLNKKDIGELINMSIQQSKAEEEEIEETQEKKNPEKAIITKPRA